MGNKLREILLLAFLGSILASCVTKHTITKEQRERTTDANYCSFSGQDIIESIKQNREILQKDSMLFNQKIQIRIYDTSTFDPDGSHPVVAEAEITTSSEDYSSTVICDSIEQETTLIQRDSTYVQINDHEISQVDTEKKIKPTVSIMVVFVSFFVCLVLWFTVLLFLKKRNII